jgi:hypothetical protein
MLFQHTPISSPDKQPVTLPEIKPQSPSSYMSNDHVNLFHGDKEDENPEDFLCSFFRRMGSSDDNAKKQQFRNFLQADSAADEWFVELPIADKKDWDAIEAAFRKRWPRKKAVKKTTEEYEEEITGLRLKMEDLGKKGKNRRKGSIFAHRLGRQDVDSHKRGKIGINNNLRGPRQEGTPQATVREGRSRACRLDDVLASHTRRRHRPH